MACLLLRTNATAFFSAAILTSYLSVIQNLKPLME